MGLALGPVARLFSRHLYVVQSNVVCWSEQISLTHYALGEIQFWIDNLAELVGQPMWHSSPCNDAISYSDTSSSEWTGYVVQLGSLVARGEWDDLDFIPSSTYRELKAVRLTLESFACHLFSKDCKHTCR